ELNKVLSCIARILRLEEEYCCSTEEALTQILIILENTDTKDIPARLINIEIKPKTPKKLSKI
ncbi:MAG: hypothetical protein N2Z79_01450, partial [Candidatus Omnitrophica bacterium]|nr:hypothetical protein [Candidatus Omnitrophota bacterium]